MVSISTVMRAAVPAFNQAVPVCVSVCLRANVLRQLVSVSA